MPIEIPLPPTRWARFRLLTRPTWAGTTASGGGWTPVIMQQPEPETSGFILLGYSRALLPQLGTMTLLFRYGQIGQRIIGSNAEAAENQRQGQQWDPSVELDIPDLTDKELRLQTCMPNAEGEDGEWRTCWWGTCEYQTDEGWGAATIPAGQRTYHCIDAFHRTKRWPLDRHGFVETVAGAVSAPMRGAIGYNVSRETSHAAGNRGTLGQTWNTDNAGTYALCHTIPGAGSLWTDEEVLTHALRAGRPKNAPLWNVTYADGAAGAPVLMESASAWPVEDGDTVWDLVTRIADRSRGRGAIFPDFSESDPLGPLNCHLRVYSQLAADFEWVDPVSDTTVSCDGAIADFTSVEVDLIGDHRFVNDSLHLTDAEQYRCDFLESQGEPIEVLVTLGYIDSTLEIGWKAEQEEAFRELDPKNRTEDKWADVLQLHRLKRSWLGSVGDGNGGTATRCDFRCDKNGAILTPTTTPDTSPAAITFLDDTPLFLGYDYTSTPFRYDSATVAAYGGDPARRGPRYFIRTESEKFLEFKELSEGFSMHRHPDGFHIAAARDSLGFRYFRADTAGNLNSAHHYNKIVVTCAIRLPHRVRMSTGSIETAKRKKTITHAGLHLWMAHPGAIWDLDSSARNAGQGAPPKRGASASTSPAGILRDDRSELARLHGICKAWWGVTTPGVDDFASMHRGATWSLRCCGDIPSSEDYDGGGVIYPTCGQVVTHIKANGQRIEVNSPVSSFVYDNLAGISTWTSDWMDLDTNRMRAGK